MAAFSTLSVQEPVMASPSPRTRVNLRRGTGNSGKRFGFSVILGLSLWWSQGLDRVVAQPAPEPEPSPLSAVTPPDRQELPIVRVGVMAIRGVEQTQTQWQPTIDYLNQAIPDHQFVLVPLEFESMEAVVQNKEIDFVLPNPGMYVELEWVYGAQRIATLKNLRLGRAYTQLGAVIFRRADRNDIQTLKDLKGKRFMGVDETAFGGWQMAWATILDAGVDPYQDFAALTFGGTHDNVVYAVLKGEVDGGTVRTDTLERMAQEGKIQRDDFVVLNQQTQYGSQFPFALSTPLYPEWPFAAFPDTPPDLSEQVAIALMTLPADSAAAIAGKYEGWTIPANYQPVHETLRQLRVRPYEDWGNVSLAMVLYQYRYWMTSLGIVVLILGYVVWQLATRQQVETNLRRANAELEQRVQARTAELSYAKDIAEAANRAKSDFLASMSHELRTPLNAILGFAQVMIRGLNPRTVTGLPPAFVQQQRETLGIIHRSGEHLLALINDVLDMSKIEAGRVTLLQDPFDFHGTLEALMEMLQLRAESKGLTLFYECDAAVPRGVIGDERKLRQVLINLLGNAIKFTDEGSVSLRVTVASGAGSTQSQGTTPRPTVAITFTVEDTGSGIAPEDLDGLFEVFVQTRVGQQSQEGTGLGLPISRQFVQLLGGDLTVDSTLGVGSRFCFTIPLQMTVLDQSLVPTETRQIMGLAPNQPTYKILVVDDIWENRQLLVQLLQPLGFEVSEADNGEVAVAQWQSQQPHLIFMDIRMPVMSGYESTRQIRLLESNQSHGPKTAIIALTASVFDDERAKIVAAGCDDFLRKPITEDYLFRKLTQYLGVAYVYLESSEARIPGQGGTAKVRGPIDLANQPRAWVAQLSLAARGAEDELIWKLLDQIPASQSALAEALAELVNDFRLDKIISLTEAAATPDPTPLGQVPPLGNRWRQVVGLAPNQPPYQVLVVDDRFENRQLLVTILEPLGFQVLQADNGQTAIDQWKQHQPDLIFMDLRMPGVNGYEATRRIKAQGAAGAPPVALGASDPPPVVPKVPVIVALTASVAESEQTAIFEAGCDDLIRKPFAESQLLQCLAHYLGAQYIYQDMPQPTLALVS
ncbi:response regulator [Prochlorothrix hollandica]|uniref:response regulator n=1 Tax=Prochlorothrix hollandica TaxID=1223 RepID=UPI000347D84E|nr:response regulator [Prochlorothrix hollandica]